MPTPDPAPADPGPDIDIEALARAGYERRRAEIAFAACWETEPNGIRAMYRATAAAVLAALPPAPPPLTDEERAAVLSSLRSCINNWEHEADTQSVLDIDPSEAIERSHLLRAAAAKLGRAGSGADGVYLSPTATQRMTLRIRSTNEGEVLPDDDAPDAKLGSAGDGDAGVYAAIRELRSWCEPGEPYFGGDWAFMQSELDRLFAAVDVPWRAGSGADDDSAWAAAHREGYATAMAVCEHNAEIDRAALWVAVERYASRSHLRGILIGQHAVAPMSPDAERDAACAEVRRLLGLPPDPPEGGA